MDLSKLVVEGFEVRPLRAVLISMGGAYDAKDQSITLLEKIVAAEGHTGDTATLDGLRRVQHIRSKVKGHAGSSEGKILAQEALVLASRVCARTIEPRIRTSRRGGGNARHSASNRLDQLNTFLNRRRLKRRNDWRLVQNRACVCASARSRLTGGLSTTCSRTQSMSDDFATRGRRTSACTQQSSTKRPGSVSNASSRSERHQGRPAPQCRILSCREALRRSGQSDGPKP
jgi:hypothetical protein